MYANACLASLSLTQNCCFMLPHIQILKSAKHSWNFSRIQVHTHHFTGGNTVICLCHWQLLESKQQCHHRRRRLCRPCRRYRYRHHCSHRHIRRGAAQREPNRHKAAAWNFPVWGGGRGGRGQFVSARGCRTASSWCTIKLTWSLIFQDLNLMNIGRSNRDTSKSFCKAGLFVWGSWPLFKCSQQRSWARGCAWS